MTNWRVVGMIHRLIHRLQYAYMALEMQLRTAREMEHV